VKNPLRDEASAFQVVLITLGGALLVVIAAWINTWLGLAVFVVLVGAALWAIRGGLIQRPPQTHVVHDVCPALNSRVRTWTSDEDPARAEAQSRLDASLARLGAAGVSARGEIGDGDPLQALEDALREFPADEIVVSTHPPGRSHWLEQGVVEHARHRYDVPITHVVVDIAVARQTA
jgi:hypothetical protein